MAQILSTEASALFNAPQQIIRQGKHKAVALTSHEVVSVGAGTNGDVIITALTVPANAKIISLEVGNTAGGAGTLDVGLFHRAANGVISAVDDDCFVAAQNVTAANARSEKIPHNEIGQAAYVHATDSNTNKREYIIGLTTDTANSSPMTVGIKLSYIPM